MCNPRDTRDRSGRYHAKVVDLPVRDPGASGSLTAASRVALDAAGQADTWKGAAALALAELIDAGKTWRLWSRWHCERPQNRNDYALEDSGESADIIDWVFSKQADDT